MIRLSDHLIETFGEKVYKLSLSSGCTCPNRDGTIGYGGCTFCSEGGSGEFASAPAPVNKQIEEAKKLIMAKSDARRFIAYFQSYTNTYGDPIRLKELYKEAISRDDIAALSLGTRPDCLDDKIMEMLQDLKKIKPVWIELGLQTIHERTALAINRGYDLKVFNEAYARLKDAGFTVIVHVILGLPGESREDMLDTIRYLAKLDPPLDGIKLQMLQVLKGTAMGKRYQKDPFPLMTLEEYASLIKECAALLPEDTVLHRMTGDGPRRLLIAPLWSLNKKRVLNTLNRQLNGD
ncbi:MAG: TIGR01212 family radical SAM protein [Lachnospiraceae bacterium]|nr:TIGR01212 family radical SAM protein [Lachnospiraceae bacterium]